MKKYTIFKASLIVLVLVIGCSVLKKHFKAYIVFIDYTKSAATFAQDNPDKINQILMEITFNMNSEDLIEVYPIHAFTGSAAPLLRLHGPKLKGDLSDKNRREEWIKNIAQPLIREIWDIKINDDRKVATNIFPVVSKINDVKKRGYKVTAYLISDMVQDNKQGSFSKVFSNNSSADPVRYAQKKVMEFQYAENLEGVKVIIKIPGTPQGSLFHERMRNNVSAFWQEFFALCGASLILEDL